MANFNYSDNNGFKRMSDKAAADYYALYNQGADRQYETDVNALYDRIMNFGDFSYDMEKDKLFQLYKAQYQREGTANARDAMGRAAANSGGYASSYAQTSANKAYQQSMDELSNKALDTYSAAYSRYNSDYNQLLNKYSTASDMNSAQQNKYYAQLGAADSFANNAYKLYQDDYNNQYNKFTDDRNFNANQIAAQRSQKNWQNEFNQQKSYNDASYELAKKKYGVG